VGAANCCMEELFRQSPFNPEGKAESVQDLYARYIDALGTNGSNCGIPVIIRPGCECPSFPKTDIHAPRAHDRKVLEEDVTAPVRHINGVRVMLCDFGKRWRGASVPSIRIPYGMDVIN